MYIGTDLGTDKRSEIRFVVEKLGGEKWAVWIYDGMRVVLSLTGLSVIDLDALFSATSFALQDEARRLDEDGEGLAVRDEMGGEG